MVDGKPQYQDNFVTLANRAGFRPVVLQPGQIGEYDTAIASIAKRADEVQFLKTAISKPIKTPDEQLLKLTEQVLSTQRTQPQLIVLHLMGSHPQACDRTKGKYTVSFSRKTSCYLYSMTQTDSLLAKLYHQLQNSGDTFPDLFFRSWSGVQGGAKRCSIWRMMISSSRTSVPFMVLSSDDKAHKVIKAQRSANDFLSFFSQWTEIRAEITHAIGLSLSKGRSGVHHQLPAAKVDYAHLGTDEFTVSVAPARPVARAGRRSKNPPERRIFISPGD